MINIIVSVKNQLNIAYWNSSIFVCECNMDCNISKFLKD